MSSFMFNFTSTYLSANASTTSPALPVNESTFQVLTRNPRPFCTPAQRCAALWLGLPTSCLHRHVGEGGASYSRKCSFYTVFLLLSLMLNKHAHNRWNYLNVALSVKINSSFLQLVVHPSDSFAHWMWNISSVYNGREHEYKSGCAKPLWQHFHSSIHSSDICQWWQRINHCQLGYCCSCKHRQDVRLHYTTQHLQQTIMISNTMTFLVKENRKTEL